jgi:uncharacterized membrane protein (DUF106 family)
MPGALLLAAATTVATTTTTTTTAAIVIAHYGIPEATFLVTLTSIILGLVTQLVTRRIVDLDAERKMKVEVGSFNKEKREVTLALSKLKRQDQKRAVTEQTKQLHARLDKLNKRQLQVTQDQMKLQSARLKVTAITIVPMLAIYYLMSWSLGGFNVIVARAPVPIPYIVSNFNLLTGGEMSLFWWYFLSSFAFSTMLAKLLHTAT